MADLTSSSFVADRPNISQMSAQEEWGLGGFLATITNPNSDVSSLARGHDLTNLGLNLNSSECALPRSVDIRVLLTNSLRPLHPTFSPFGDQTSRPLQPDYKLPECYTVDNVQRVRDKLPSFTDETLFWIFYSQPRDMLQELAATEL